MAVVTVPVALALYPVASRTSGWIAGGAGLAVASMGFPLLGRENPLIGVGGLAALVGLVGFYAWAGVLLLQSRLAAG